MKDIRLKELPFELEGKTYMLRCNMNVLADVQEAYDGYIGEALAGSSTYKSLLHFLAAMLNDFADDVGWEERWTAKQLGRIFALYELPKDEIMEIITNSIIPDTKEHEAAGEEAPAETGN